jgi:hypothetical protein
MKDFNRGVSQYNKGIGKMNKSTSKFTTTAGKQFTGLGRGMLKFGAIAGGAALVGIAALGAGVVTLGVVSVDTAIKFESAFAGVVKTTDGLTDSTGNLNAAGQELRQGFVDLSKEVPTAFEELAGIGEIGGQLGIGKESLIDFTEIVAALGVSTNLTTEAAATGLARLSNIFGVSTDDMSGNIANLGNSLVALGNQFPTTEAEILAFGERLAGAGAIAGLTQADVLGIGTAMSSVGVEAEAGGTSVQKVLLAMNNAVAGAATGFVDYSDKIDKNVGKMTKLNAESARLEAQFPGLQSEMLAAKEAFIASGGSAEDFGRQLGDKTRQKALELAEGLQEIQAETDLLRSQHGQPVDSKMLATFAKTAGLSAEEFKKAWQEDASAAFEMFVGGLAKEGDNAVSVLEDLGLADQRVIRAFLSLAGAGDILSDAVALSNKEFEDGSALQTEAQKRYATTESQLAIFRNTIRAAGDAIGSRFLPFLNRLVSIGKDLVNKFAGPIADAIDQKVIPAIESVIALGGELFAAFQTGGVGGLAEALGITPDIMVLFDLIKTSISDLAAIVSSNLTPAFNEFGGIIPTINSIISFMVEHFDEIKGALIGVGAVLAGGIFAALVAALLALLSPINLIIAAAALLGAAWAGNWGGIREITASVIDFIMGVITVLAETFNSVILPQIQEAFNNLTEALNSMGLNWGDVWNAIVEAIKIVGIAIGVVIGGIITIIVGLVSGFASALATATSLFDEFGRAFTSIIEGIATLFAGFATLIEGIMIGDWATIWEGAILIFEGFAQTFLGVMDLLVVTVQSAIATMLSFFSGFAEAVISIFTGLASTLVGNSIIPDMVQAIIDTFTGMIEGITNAIGGITEIIGGIFSGIFGGEAFDIVAFTEVLPQALSNVTVLFNQVTTAVTNLAAQLSDTLTEAATIFATITLGLLAQIHDAIMQIDLLLIKVHSETLPTLQTVVQTTTQIFVAGFTQINETLRVTIDLLGQIISLLNVMVTALQAVASAAKAATAALADMADTSDLEDLEDILKDIEEKLWDIKTAASAVVSALGGMGGALLGIGFGEGIGLRRGRGFQGGTPGHRLGLGWPVPSGYPNDSFPMNVTSGEEVLVTPPGMSIESLIFDRLAALLSGSIRGGSVQAGKTVQVNFNAPISISSGMDWDDFQMGVERTVAGAF